MPSLFSKVFKKDSTPKKVQNGVTPAPAKPRWTDAWQRTEVEAEEVQELLHGCTAEVKSRALEMPFLLLPFRPASDPSAARTFVRNYFGSGMPDEPAMSSEKLAVELRLAEPMVLCSVLKWCWSRLPGGVVTWDAYELFKIGEHDSNNAHDAFATFIPISTANDARMRIVVDFFDLLAAVAAHGKRNGFPGRKLARYAGWWAFEHKNSENGFEGGYQTWTAAANATCHLFFAYLRSLAPDAAKGALALPRSLQALLEQTEYPPVAQNILQNDITKVVMVVDSVSPTPFALLRRAKNFEYRSDDQVLQSFSEFDDPVQALTDECKRILQGIATANDSSSAKLSTSLRDVSWSRFEDIGFSMDSNEDDVNDGLTSESALRARHNEQFKGLRSTPASTTDVGRPTTPSWADFLSSGFGDQGSKGPTSLLPPDKQLPPISVRGSSAHSYQRGVETNSQLGSGELASITPISIDDVFWWVWISSLAGEETTGRKAIFGRCALIETKLHGGSWLLIEEVLKGAKAEPANAAYVAEKKSLFGFRKRANKNPAKAIPTKASSKNQAVTPSPTAKRTFAPDQHARIQAAAAALSQRSNTPQPDSVAATPERRGRADEHGQSRTTSTLTLQPIIMNEAAPAMKWASSYDKSEIRSKYLGDRFAGRGSAIDLPTAEKGGEVRSTNGSVAPPPVPAKDVTVEETTFREPARPAQVPSTAPERLPFPDQATPSRKPVVASPTISQSASPTPAAIPLPVSPPQPDQSPFPRPMQRIEPPARGISLKKTGELQAEPEYSKEPILVGKEGPEPDKGESSPLGPNKLRKKNAPNRFGSIFGRKKTGEDTVNSPRPAPAANASSGSAVAAARAALEAKAQRTTTSPPRKPVMAQRLSIADAPGTQQQPISRIMPSTKAIWGPPTPADEAGDPSATTEQMHLTREKAYEPSYTTDSNVDDTESHAAEREFSRFDQGPLQDAPTYQPTYDDEGSQISALTDEPTEKSAEDSLDTAEVAAGTESVIHHVPSNEAPDQVPEIETHNQGLSHDRWAQIRKNAAERVAARQSEEASRRTTHTEDDGETSGEETIESRVARIKARVAVLTGNMEAPSQRQH